MLSHILEINLANNEENYNKNGDSFFIQRVKQCFPNTQNNKSTV